MRRKSSMVPGTYFSSEIIWVSYEYWSKSLLYLLTKNWLVLYGESYVISFCLRIGFYFMYLLFLLIFLEPFKVGVCEGCWSSSSTSLFILKMLQNYWSWGSNMFCRCCMFLPFVLFLWWGWYFYFKMLMRSISNLSNLKQSSSLEATWS